MANFKHASKQRKVKSSSPRTAVSKAALYGGNIDRILQLQRTIGNQATIELLQREESVADQVQSVHSVGQQLEASEGRPHPTNPSQSGHSRERHVLENAKVYTSATTNRREQKKTAFGSKIKQNIAVAEALNSSDGKSKVKAVLDGTSPREFIVASYSGEIYDVRRGSVFQTLDASGVKVGIEKANDGTLHFVTAYPTK